MLRIGGEALAIGSAGGEAAEAVETAEIVTTGGEAAVCVSVPETGSLSNLATRQKYDDSSRLSRAFIVTQSPSSSL